MERLMYRCDECDFDLHLKCASMKPKVKYEGHNHLVILVENIIHRSNCEECGFVIEDTFFVRCVACRLDFHILCGPFSLPPTIVHKHHLHPLTLNTQTPTVKDDSDLLYCDACETERNPKHPFYFCSDCDYSAHVRCVITEISIPPEKREKLKHFGHYHTLFLHDKEENDDLFCLVCQKDIKGTIYGCDPCRFYLHKPCAELPRAMRHPFHQHALTLLKPQQTKFICDACCQECYGSPYRCNECYFYLDLDCASLRPSIKFEGHKHLLTFVKKFRDLQKSINNSEISSNEPSYLRCARCDFNVDIASSLPKFITHRSHPHSLSLQDGFGGFVEHDPSEYRCAICKTKIDDGGRVYCCAECCFVLDFQCVVSEVLLSLKGETFSKAVDEGTYAAEGEKEIKINNYFLHRHPLTPCDNDGEPLCHGCGSPCLGESYSCSKCGFYSEGCIACNRSPSGSYYTCKLCWPKSPLFHKSCVELPQEIQISYHPHHSLHLTEGFEDSNDSELCHFCGKRGGFSNRCKFCCDKCDFQIHFECIAMLIKYHEGREQVKHFSHPHNLTHLDFGVVDCGICDKKIHGPSYGCAPCEFYMHNSCSDLPQEIQHPFHQLHWLRLQTSSLPKYCDACDFKIMSSMWYGCNNCDFDLHLECTSLKPNIKYEGHEHLLVLVENMSSQSECEACGSEIQGTFYVRCVVCNINFHVQCGPVSLPPTVIDKHHKHPLTLSSKTVLDDNDSGCDLFFCDDCNKERNPEHPFYTCTECDYSTHARCVVTEVQLIEREKLRHFSHQHFLFPLEDRRNGDIFCYACEERNKGPVYGCDHCKLYLHKSCAKLPRQIEHPFHEHPLTLPNPYSRKEHECSACHKHSSGLTYRCNDCDFDLDLDCASLQPSIKYETHWHPLTFFKKLYDMPKCFYCSFTPPDISYLRCVKCNINVHLRCMPLPETIKHESHRHSLSLMDSYVDDKYDEQICDVCEEGRDAAECVYYCAECDFIAEFNCVIFEVVHSFKEERGNIQLKSVKRESDQNRDHKEVRKCLTLEDMFEDLSTEDANKFADDVNKFADIILQFVESFPKMGVDGSEDDAVVGSEDNVPVLENVPRSYEAFVRFITRLVGNKLETHVEALLDLITGRGKDEVVNVGDYMITEELAPVLQKLLANYDHDITGNCALSDYFKTVCLSLLGEVVQGLCNTKTMEITDKLFLQWWFNLKFVQHSGFKIDFVLNHLQKAGHARFRTDIEINQKSLLYRTLEEMDKVEQTIDELSQKIDELSQEMSKQKAKLEKLKNKKQGIISSHGSESSRSAAARFIEVMEHRMKNAGTGLL